MHASVLKLSMTFCLGLALTLLFSFGKAKNESLQEKEAISSVTVFASQWFMYVGPPHTDPNYDPHNPENYAPMGNIEPTCEGEEEVCGLYGEGKPSELVPNLIVPSDDTLESLEHQINNKIAVDDQLTFRD